MAGRREVTANMEFEESATDGPEGVDTERKGSAARDKSLVKRQRSRGPAKKKERTFDWPKKSLYETVYVDSVSHEEVRRTLTVACSLQKKFVSDRVSTCIIYKCTRISRSLQNIKMQYLDNH